MNKKYSLVLVVLLCSFFYGYGQIKIAELTFETAGGYTTSVAECTDNSGDYFIRTDGTNINATFLNIQDTFFFAAQDLDAAGCPAAAGANATLLLNDVNISGYTSLELRVHIAEDDDGANQDWDSSDLMHFDFDLDNSGAFSNLLWVESTGGTNTVPAIDTDFDGVGDGTVITDTFTQFTNSITGTGNLLDIRVTFDLNTGDEDIAIDNIEIWGISSCTDTADFQNIQSPTASPQTITVGDVFNVYAQVYEPTVTEAAGAGAGIEAWIGYNTTNDNPNNNVGWTWIPATFNTQAGNNDEFTAEIGSGLATGTYYYASRFRLNSCGFTYGGTGGNWNNDSVQLIVNPDQVDFCNVDFPKTGNITTGDNFNVYAQAYEPGVTDAAGQGANIQAWIGYNTIGINYQPWNTTGWTWVVATYDSDAGPSNNNDQYVAEIGSGLPAGTYYYASRFQLNGSDVSYGGIQFDNVGNFWDATNNNGTLTITNPPLADVVITEIMYNPPGANDYEWIEICNLNGTAQDVSNYTIDVNGTTQFTFPPSTTIPANSCITVLLGHLVSSPAPECPFTPDYSNPIGNTNVLFNGGATIELVASFGTTADIVAYDDADSNATDGNGSSFHVIDATLNNADTATNWQAVADGGSPGTNTLVSPCSAPELQLVNSSNVDQTCGAFTIDFGSQATGFNTDLTFDIDNDGTLDLTISSLTFSGGNPSDFSIVSPAATPFTITSGNTQTVTVRFTPSALGNRTATLTINNNDADEGTCTIALQGIGTTPAPEINVEGDIGTFPDIANNDTTPSGTDNTLFAAQFIGSSQAKSFRIQNLGTADLTVSSVTIGGANPADFSVSIAPAGTVTDLSTDPLNVTTFEITFAPLTVGVNKTADISIANNDSDEDPYTFRVQGTGLCVANAITITPTSGPEGTVVTVTGTNLSSATASFNGLAASVTNISATEMEVTVPAGATTGNLEVTDDLGCPGSAPFSVIDTQISTCEGGTALTELFISEVTDATYGSLTYIELYNATGSNINLANYEIRIYANGNTGSFTSQTLSGTINADDTFVITTGTFGVLGGALCATPGGDGVYGDLISNTLQGVNISTGNDDYIGLYNSSVLIDEFGVFGDDDWTSSTILTGDRGYNFRRLNSATPLPSTSYNNNDWNIIDWIGSGSTTCITTNDYSDIGVYDFSTGTPPSVTLQPSAPSSTCDLSATLTVAGTEGYNGGLDTQELAYQWYFSAPGDTGWTAVTNAAPYTGFNTATLNISSTLNLDGYQYYCQVREDDATCYTASNAIKLTVQTTEWDGTSWSDGIPDINTIATISGNYNTTTNGSFSACQLFVNATYTLRVEDNTYIEVQNDVTVDGTVLVTTRGSFVQRGDASSAGVYTNNGTSTVQKTTVTFNSSITGNYNYTYWSSPVANADIATVFPNPIGNRRYYFQAENYLDATAEVGNNNATVAGQDDIDDNADDWQNASGIMDIGRGYAVTAVSGPPMAPWTYSDSADFIGEFNTGDVVVNVYKNDSEAADNNWNFIGNPYPSAIDAQLFLTENTTIIAANPTAPINGAIFLWSQGTAADSNTNGNEVLNFSQSDYAIINGLMGTAGTSGVIPDPYIPSGQGFFISYAHGAADIGGVGTIRRNEVRFTNSMRVTGNNAQFFRVVLPNKLWLNLTSDNGVFSQIGLGYISGATDGYDGMYYDAPRNLSTGAYSILYSIIEDSDKKFAIQGKDPNSLNLDEIIPLGFYTSIDEATLYTFSIEQLEGDFLTNNTIYLKDNAMNVIHNLSDSDYTFTSDVGEFNERFEIVFNRETLSVGENELNPNDLTIVELNDAEVRFTVSNNFQIKSVEIIDLLGRTIYRLQGTSSSETYNLSNLSKSAYIAKVELSNGQIITKKAIKRH